ncbi:hypothetical protein HQ571_04350 [Candidatus Kuenenbacteria bacterium]|nr:hypothetical protein [Candidatus Kuenenbacteria bacterium]
MKNQMKSNQIRNSIIIVILIVIIIAALMAVDLIYFKPQENIDNEGPIQLLNLDSDSDSNSEFEKVKQALLEDEQFLGLEKVGDWPLVINEEGQEFKENPFENIEEVE